MTTTAVATAAIEARGLAKEYGSVKALRGLDLEVPPRPRPLRGTHPRNASNARRST